MGYFTLITALGIILLFGYWSGRHRRKLQKRQEPKVYPLSRSKKQTYLRRIK